MSIQQVIKWNAPPNVLAWKFPSGELCTWSQLIVSESQEAYLLKEGQFVGPFGPGRHTLDTKNYPILTNFISHLVSGGMSPFTAEVWFIQKAFTLDIRWGTSDAMMLEDPTYHIILPVHAFGQYGVQVDNSGLFLSKLVGTLPAFTTKTLSEYFKGMLVTVVKDTIGKYFVEKNISLLKLSACISDVSENVEEKLGRKLQVYGVHICNFAINSISTDERDPAVARLRQALAQRAEMDIMGYNYQQMRSFDVMQTVASNDGMSGAVQSSFMGAGMGMGMGAGIGQIMGNCANSVAQQIAPPACVCPACHTPSSPEANFCSFCGHDLRRVVTPQMQEIICPSCGQKNTMGSRFCTHCGTKFDR